MADYAGAVRSHDGRIELSGPAAWPEFAARFLAAELPAVPELDNPALALRMLSDDIKALYGEAAQAEGSAPSAHQIDTWFWRQTVAGRLLIALRAMAMASENNALKTVGGGFSCRPTGCLEQVPCRDDSIAAVIVLRLRLISLDGEQSNSCWKDPSCSSMRSCAYSRIVSGSPPGS